MHTSHSLSPAPLRIPHSAFRTQRGVALIIVLAFIVLLTGLVVAFFSRAMSERQVANSSANMLKADIFAQGAVDSIIGDFRQEIADGSTLTNGVYVPKPTAAGAMSTIVPDRVGSTATLTASQLAGLENLIKQSTSAKPFYNKSTNSNYTASGPSRASTALTSALSINSRSVSAARWNKPLFMDPNTVPSSPTYLAPNNTSFKVPNWILVARDGSNPTTWNANLQTSSTNNTSVVGRYAYNIYNEGGTLDMNVAGYPSTMTTAPAVPYYKNALAFADLTQIPGLSSFNTGANPVTNTVVDSIVGWRNYASAAYNASTAALTPLSGTFPSYAWTTIDATNYFNYVASNNTGFLSSANTVLANSQSDHPFTSRQQLMKFLLQGVAGTSAANKANLQKSLQYLGTFSRDVSQPAYVPPLYTDSTAPTVQPAANGGNNQSGLDKQVNPSFLDSTVQVATPFTRNDGTQAVKGEPLVKRRFPLSRLAWITYKGPSAARTMSDPDMQTLINTYGVSQSFLQQGTDANIKAYFGLKWNGTLWTYDQHNGTSGTGPTGAIMRLVDIVALGAKAHEPDFFELLKASISAGSKAKTSTPTNGGTTTVYDVQYQRDVSFDYAIIQIGANIIQQSRVDGYCVRISFNDGTFAREFQGVENLPYIYRVRWGVLKVRNEKPLTDANDQTNYTNTGAHVLVDPGVAMLMYLPEIWNPYSQDCPLPAVRPTNFRIVADSTDPVSAVSGGIYTNYKPWAFDYNQGSATSWRNDNFASYGGTTDSGGQKIPYFSRTAQGTDTITGDYRGSARELHGDNSTTKNNTAITFSITQTLYREPTLLAMQGQPAGSNIAIGWTVANDPDLSKLGTSGGLSWTGTGFKADISNPLTMPTAPTANQAYVGVVVGLFPVQWVYTGKNNLANSDVPSAGGTNVNGCTWRLQYQDTSGTWVTYDTKYIQNPTSAFNISSIRAPSPFGGMMQARGLWASYTDPRTSRFGAASTQLGSSAIGDYAPPGAAVSQSGNRYALSESTPVNSKEWLSTNTPYLISNRPFTDSGYFFNPPASTYSTAAQGWCSPGFAQGLFSQNSTTAIDNGKKYSGAFNSANNSGNTQANFYTDADGVVRRAMGGYVTGAPAATTIGLPMASTFSAVTQRQSRPWFLHRPFRSVAELGYVFSDMPWKDLDFFTPESGDAALLDVFCINDTNDSGGMVAGKVNLNTKQANVLKAVIANSYTDEQNPTAANSITSIAADTIVNDPTNGLIARTTSATLGKGPMQNISELVGKWSSKVTTTAGGAANPHNIDGSLSYGGFSKDLGALLTPAYGANSAQTNIKRFREAPIRALANAGQTRVWNLMIDVIAQTGRYPGSAANLDNFVVEGEQRYWVHLAIDRLKGTVIDKQIEIVKE
jgi:Tfp pilus assembly protein PilX